MVQGRKVDADGKTAQDKRKLNKRQSEWAAKHHRMGWLLAKKYRPPFWMTQEEWASECMMCVVHAAYHYRKQLGKPGTFIDKFVRTHRQQLIRAHMTQRNGGGVIPLSIYAGDSEGRTDSIASYLQAKDVPSRLDSCELAEKLIGMMTEAEFRIVSLAADDHSARLIATKLNISKTTVMKILSRFRLSASRVYPELSMPIGRCGCGNPIFSQSRGGETTWCAECHIRREDLRKKYLYLSREERKRRMDSGESRPAGRPRGYKHKVLA